MIAFEATGHNIVPGFSAPFDDRDHVIERQVLRRAFSAAVLADVIIPGVDVRAAELDVLEALANLHVFQEPEHTGELDREADASDLPVVLGQNFHLALVQQSQGTLPGNDIDGFVAGVKN